MDNSHASRPSNAGPSKPKDNSGAHGNASDEHPKFLATTRPTAPQRRIALWTLGASVALCGVAVPFAKTPLPHIIPFVTICQTVFVTNALVTAILLFGQFRILQSWSLLVLGCGYLFSSSMALGHTLSFPGLFFRPASFSTETQTTAWLYVLWHGGFALFLTGYGLLNARGRIEKSASTHINFIMLTSVIGVLVLALFLAILATTTSQLFPPLMIGTEAAPLKVVFATATCLFGLIALSILWFQRNRSILDLGLLVMICVWILHIALEAILNRGRFDVGWYAGRFCGVIAESIVLLMLLFENSVLYSRLVVFSEQVRKRGIEQLEVSEARFDAAFEQAAVGMALVGLDNRWIRANRKVCEILGYSEQELLKFTLNEIAEPGSMDRELNAMRAILGGELNFYSAEKRCRCKSGRTTWIQLTISLARRLDNTPVYFIFVIEDIQERKEAALALAQKEARYRAVIETTTDGFCMANREGRILMVNDAYVRRSGYSREELQFMSIRDLEARESPQERLAHVEKVVRTGGDLFETLHRSKDGKLWPVEIKVSYSDMNGGIFFIFLRDLSGKRSLERQIVEASTAEQERIGRDIHDGIGQQLTGISMLASGLQRGLEAADYADVANTVGIIREQLKFTLDEAHALAAGFAPVEIAPDGLTDALRALITRIGSVTGIVCRYRKSGDVRIAAGDAAIQLYRIAQEALQNAVKHANPKHIDVHLGRAYRHVVLTITDDGKGMPQKQQPYQGLGMSIMAYRADIIGARLRIEAVAGGGTRVRCELPLKT